MTGETITADEIKTALEKHFATLIGNLICHNFALEKQLSTQADFIGQMTANEAALVDRIQEMEAELIRLRPPPSSLSPDLQTLAEAGTAAIRGE